MGKAGRADQEDRGLRQSELRAGLAPQVAGGSPSPLERLSSTASRSNARTTGALPDRAVQIDVPRRSRRNRSVTHDGQTEGRRRWGGSSRWAGWSCRLS